MSKFDDGPGITWDECAAYIRRANEAVGGLPDHPTIDEMADMLPTDAVCDLYRRYQAYLRTAQSR